MQFEAAKEVVERYLEKEFAEKYSKITVLDDRSSETRHGWLFYYQTRRYLETGKKGHALIGNGPLLVDSKTGRIVVFGSSGSVEYYLGLYDLGQIREGSDGAIHLSRPHNNQQG